MKEGFNIQVWESFQQDLQNTYANPEKYLLQLRNEENVYCSSPSYIHVHHPY